MTKKILFFRRLLYVTGLSVFIILFYSWVGAAFGMHILHLEEDFSYLTVGFPVGLTVLACSWKKLAKIFDT